MLDATVQAIDKLLDQIVTENDKLANPALSWESVQTAAQSLGTRYQDLDMSASADEAFGKKSKPIAAPKTGA